MKTHYLLLILGLCSLMACQGPHAELEARLQDLHDHMNKDDLDYVNKYCSSRFQFERVPYIRSDWMYENSGALHILDVHPFPLAGAEGRFIVYQLEMRRQLDDLKYHMGTATWDMFTEADAHTDIQPNLAKNYVDFRLLRIAFVFEEEGKEVFCISPARKTIIEHFGGKEAYRSLDRLMETHLKDLKK